MHRAATVALATLMIISCQSAGSDPTPDAPAGDSAPPWDEEVEKLIAAADDADTDAAAAPEWLAKLYDNNGCRGGAFYVKRSMKNLGKASDDKRSMTLYGPAGTVATVYDSDDWTLDDDYAIIVKKDNRELCVPTFENRPTNQWIDMGRYRMFYRYGGNLDGKVTSIRFGRWWSER